MGATDQCFITEKTIVDARPRSESVTVLERLGIRVSWYGLVVTLLLIGVLSG